MSFTKKIFFILPTIFIPAVTNAADLQATVDTSFGYATVVGFGTQELRTTIFLILNILFGFLGIIAILGILYGGFVVMTAGGNEERSGGGRKAIYAGVIGLAIIFAAFSIATFVVNSLVNATT